MKIEFPPMSTYSSTQMVVAFPADYNNSRHKCVISAEALQDHFDGAGQDLGEVFEMNRSAIEAVARRKILDGAQEPIFLRSADF